MNRLGGHRRKAFRSVGGGSPLLTDLASWWDLTANGNDSHGSNNLSNRGAPTFGTVAGYDCVTTDSSNHLYIPAPSGLVSTAFTVACWVYETSTGAARVIASMNDGTNSADIRFSLRSGNGTLQFVVSYGVNQSISGATIPLTTWVPVIGAFDGATGDVSIWMNGTEATNSGWTAAVGSFGFGIGGSGNGGSGAAEFTGSIKSCGVWNRKFVASDATAYINGGVPLVYSGL